MMEHHQRNKNRKNYTNWVNQNEKKRKEIEPILLHLGSRINFLSLQLFFIIYNVIISLCTAHCI